MLTIRTGTRPELRDAAVPTRPVGDRRNGYTHQGARGEEGSWSEQLTCGVGSGHSSKFPDVAVPSADRVCTPSRQSSATIYRNQDPSRGRTCAPRRASTGVNGRWHDAPGRLAQAAVASCWAVRRISPVTFPTRLPSCWMYRGATDLVSVPIYGGDCETRWSRHGCYGHAGHQPVGPRSPTFTGRTSGQLCGRFR